MANGPVAEQAFSKSDIDALSLQQLSEAESDQALQAFNGFAALFGKDWLTAPFQGAKFPDLVREIAATWDSWQLVAPLTNSDQIVTRWRGFWEEGVRTELSTIARLLRAGADVELFPKVEGRVPDCSATIVNEGVLFEISQRGISKIRKRSEHVLNLVATAAANAAPDKHAKVGILKQIDDNELEQLLLWLMSNPKDGERLTDIAVLNTSSLDDVTPQNFDEMAAIPSMFCTSMHMDGGKVNKRGTSQIGISDKSAQNVLETEADQLPREPGGVVVLDISSVIGGIAEWAPLIKRRFQPNINKRIRAVVLQSQALGGEVSVELLINPHARTPLSAQAIESMKTIFA